MVFRFRRRASSPRISMAKVSLKPKGAPTARLKRFSYSVLTRSKTFSRLFSGFSFRTAVRAVPVYSG